MEQRRNTMSRRNKRNKCLHTFNANAECQLSIRLKERARNTIFGRMKRSNVHTALKERIRDKHARSKSRQQNHKGT